MGSWYKCPGTSRDWGHPRNKKVYWNSRCECILLLVTNSDWSCSEQSNDIFQAQAMFCSLDIRYAPTYAPISCSTPLISLSCDAQGIKPKKKGEGASAYELLFQAVQSYFINGCTDFDSKVRRTALPPVYFQHPGTPTSSYPLFSIPHIQTNTFRPFHDNSRLRAKAR